MLHEVGDDRTTTAIATTMTTRVLLLLEDEFNARDGAQ